MVDAPEELVHLARVAREAPENALAAVQALEDLLERAGRVLHVRHGALQVDERRLAELAVPYHRPEESLAALDRLEDDPERGGHLDDVGHDVIALPEYRLVVDGVDGRDQAARRQGRRVGRAGRELDVAVAEQAEGADGGDAVLADARRRLADHVDQHLDVAGSRVGRKAHLGDRADRHAGEAHRCADLEAVRPREVHLVLYLPLPELLLASERHDRRHQDGQRHEDEEPDPGGLGARRRRAHRPRALMRRSGTRAAGGRARRAPPRACP